MNPTPESHRNLQSFPAFSQLEPESLALLAGQFEEKSLPVGRDIFCLGETVKFFYLLEEGSVSLWRPRGGGEKQAGLLGPGDAFGEDFFGRKGIQTVTAYAETECRVLRARVGPLREMLAQHPGAQAALRALVRANQLVGRVEFPWLEPDERVFFATRKAQALLVPDLALPVLLLIVSAAGALYLSAHLSAGWMYLLPAAGLVLALGLGLWQALDWSNDYFLITNRRVVAMRRVPLIYDDRQEVPLGMVQSVSVSRSVTQRAFGFGDVTIRTFTRPIVFDSIPDPDTAARLLDAVCKQNRAREQESDRGEIERMLAERIVGRGHPDGAAPSSEPPLADQPASAGPDGAKTPGRFETRFELDGTITYRKHPFFLVRNAFLPILLAVCGILLAVGWVSGVFPVSPLVGLTIGLGVAAAGAAWAAYEYVDWANDLYQLTAEQILAIHRRPLGDEERRAAALENILSLEYDRPSPLARLLDFGTVKATVGQVNFTFDEVRDPVHVQEDIFRRMEARRRRREEQARRERREELAEWIGAYHEMTRGADEAPPEDDA